MRLLHTKNLTLKEFFDSELPKYAILSHRWIRDEEVSYEDFIQKRMLTSSGYRKIVESCKQALSFSLPDDSAKQRGLEWIWIDTCCIDKRSSAELSEAINSMYLHGTLLVGT